ncbi:MAG: hypothetical protein K2M55_06355 [Muribaculaceae bacterium]|nr:hypothetical protein [Muribaculaceae bacterium]
MKRFLALAGIAIAIGAQAQIATVSAPEALLQDVRGELYNPILSADGTKLLYSASDFSNLRMYDFNVGESSLICDEAGAGYGAQFAGNTVVYIAQKVNDNGLIMRQLRKYDIGAGANANLTAPARFIERPYIDGTAMNTAIDGKRRSIGKSAAKAVRTEGSTLYITTNGVERAYSPVASEAGYLWESFSPDGQKVMFFAAGKGIVITDLNGNVLATPGNFENPQWYGNDYIVAQNSTDDGHQYSSSQIVLVSLDGKQRQDLTTPESMTMNPAASVAAQKVVYNTIDGRMYQMTVKLNK